MPTQHGYTNLAGDFVNTNTLAEAVDAWRAERGYSTGGVYDMGGGEVVDTRNVQSAPATPTAPVTPTVAPVPAAPLAVPSYDVQSVQGGGVPNAPVQGTYTPTQATQGTGTQQAQYTPTQQTQGTGTVQQTTQGNATPAEQSAAQGGGTPDNIQPYSDLQSWFNPFDAGGYGTPAELGAGGGYGPSSVQWSEDANNLALMKQGVSPVAMAENAVNTVYSFLTDFGVRPDFITPYVQERLGLTPQDMIAMGYAQDPYGRWILLDFGDAQAGAGGSGGGSYSGGSYGGGGGGGSGGSSFRSGYTSGLINWRIGV